ncbi:MAG: hypothetical protein KDE57_01630 [Calditrichaeota bacterium]|nr:hypothetical protein [Calditrichota bacterium]MCB9070040.1 hypothetical protein [Calditrichia bacterium]
MGKIIVFTGPVGAGKSFCSRLAASRINDQGLDAYYVRFRLITLKSFFEKKRKIRKVNVKYDKPENEHPEPMNRDRFANFRLRSHWQFPVFAIVYLLRSYLFFLLIKLRYANDIVLTDRFIHDHLTHYPLHESNYYWMYRLIFKFAPKTDLVLILNSSTEVLMAARPRHSQKYLDIVSRNYHALADIFPGTILVENDSVFAKADAALGAVDKLLSNSGMVEAAAIEAPVYFANYLKSKTEI